MRLHYVLTVIDYRDKILNLTSVLSNNAKILNCYLKLETKND